MTVKGKTLHDLTDKRCLVKNKASNPLEDMRERRRGPHRTDVHSLAPIGLRPETSTVTRERGQEPKQGCSAKSALAGKNCLKARKVHLYLYEEIRKNPSKDHEDNRS